MKIGGEREQRIGDWLEQLRINAGKSRMQVGEAGGIHHRTVERVETGHYADPRWSTIAKILTGIGVDELGATYGTREEAYGQLPLDVE